MFRRAWALLRATVEGYIEDDAMSRGAAIAYYTIFSLAPLLVISMAIAGLFFGQQAVEGAVAEELRGLLGQTGAETVQALVRSAANRDTGSVATIIGVVVLLVLASAVFAELQAALDAIWGTRPPPASSTKGTVAQLVRARIAAFGLVAATGFLLLVSLLASAAIAAFAAWAQGRLPGTALLLSAANFVLSFLMVTALFAAIYKLLPHRPLDWRDVGVGAFATAFLFTAGKSLIGWYLATSAVTGAYGAAGALLVVLLWIYYSVQIFLLGAEFTRTWAGLRRGAPVVAEPHGLGSKPRRPPRERGTNPIGMLASATIGAVAFAVLRRRR
jgi:membrane protein